MVRHFKLLLVSSFLYLAIFFLLSVDIFTDRFDGTKDIHLNC